MGRLKRLLYRRYVVLVGRLCLQTRNPEKKIEHHRATFLDGEELHRERQVLQSRTTANPFIAPLIPPLPCSHHHHLFHLLRTTSSPPLSLPQHPHHRLPPLALPSTNLPSLQRPPQPTPTIPPNHRTHLPNPRHLQNPLPIPLDCRSRPAPFQWRKGLCGDGVGYGCWV